MKKRSLCEIESADSGNKIAQKVPMTQLKLHIERPNDMKFTTKSGPTPTISSRLNLFQTQLIEYEAQVKEPVPKPRGIPLRDLPPIPKPRTSILRKIASITSVTQVEKPSETKLESDVVMDTNIDTKLDGNCEDLQVMDIEEAAIPIFKPIGLQTRLNIASNVFNLSVTRFQLACTNFGFEEKQFKHSVHPKVLRKIIPDGNCYFRTLSWLFTGDENSHSIIRKTICDFIIDPENWSFLAPHCAPSIDGSSYVKTYSMHLIGTWSTDVEIIATARMTGKDVHVCLLNEHIKTQMWTVYPASGCSSTPSSRGIYIRNFHNHFEPITV